MGEVLKLTPNSIQRLKDNNPLYKFVDYYTEAGTIDTMTVEEYKRSLTT